MKRFQQTQTCALSFPPSQISFDRVFLILMLAAFNFLSFSMNANSNENIDNNTTIEESNLEDSNFTNAEEFTCDGISFASYLQHDPVCGTENGSIRANVNNPNNYCLVYALYNYTTDSWQTGYQTSKEFRNLPAGEYRIKMYRDLNCDINNVNTACYTASDYLTLTCENLCTNNLTINNTGNDAAQIYWWVNTWDQYKTTIQPGESWTTTTYDTYMWRAINDNPDWNNLLYDEHVTISGCSSQTWNISPNYSGSCSAKFEHVDGVNESSCNANDGKIITDPHIDLGTVLPYSVKYTYNGQVHTAGPYSVNQDNEITGLAPGVYSNITIVDANGCEDVYGSNITISEFTCQNTCDNFTDGGVISESQSICPGSSVSIGNIELPSGGSGAIEYLWIYNHSGAITDGSSNFPNSNQATYTIDNITETVWVRRCARRENCNPYEGESNWIKITADNNACNNNTGNPCSSISENIPEFVYLGESNGSKYYCSENNKTWSQAISLVQANGGELAVINDAAENNFLASNIQASEAWIGYTDKNNEGTFSWYNGDPSTYTNWVSGEPNDQDPTYTGADYTVLSKSNGNWYDRNGQNAYEVIMEIKCGGTPPTTDCTAETIVDFDMNGCTSFNNDGSNYDYSEFIPAYPNSANFTSVNATNVFRNAGAHSCIAGQGGSGEAACFGVGGLTSFQNNSDLAIRFEVTVDPSQTGHLTGLMFHEMAPDYYHHISGDSGTNNYPKKYGVRVTKNGNEIFKQIDINTTQSWSMESFDFSNDPDFAVTSTTTFKFELLSYDAVSLNGATLSAWDLDNIRIKGTGCSDVVATTIGNFVFNDINGNGIQETGEFGLPGVTVMLLDAAGNMVATTATNQDGIYTFTDVAPGQYKVKFPATGSSNDLTYILTQPNQGGNDGLDSDPVVMSGTNDAMTGVFTVNAGDDITDIDAGYFIASKITGVTWDDKNANGIQDPNEPNIDGVTVMLLDGDGNVVATTTTAGNGVYTFDNLAPGDYKVKFPVDTDIASTDFTLTTPNVGGNDNTDSDAVPMTDGSGNSMTQIVSVANGQTIDNLDAGYYAPATIGNKVFEDKNGNGIQDTNEPGIDGVTVMLLDTDGNIVGTTTTTGGGLYGFGNLVPGDYKVKFTSPNGYTFTSPNQGNDDDKDSDATPMTGTDDAMSTVLTINGGDDISNVDAGLYVPAKIGNFVFEDTNENGIQDTGEPGIAGVTVMLLDGFGNPTGLNATTDFFGIYQFTDLAPGDYKVKFPQTTSINGVNADLTTPNQGANDNIDSDAVSIAGTNDAMSQVITLESGDDEKSIDAGYIPGKGSIGNLVFEDTNGNGIQDTNEPGIDGVTVMLLDTDGNIVGSTTTTGGGLYGFDNVPAGDYKVKFTAPAGNTFTTANAGNDDDKDSDATPMTGTDDAMTTVFTVNAGDEITNVDAGLYVPAKIGNFVFEDTNENGVQDTGEPGIEGVTVMLLDEDGNMAAPVTTTNANGFYIFDDLHPGSYQVKFPQSATTNSGVPADLTTPNQGGNDDKDSDAVIVPGTNDAISQIVFVGSGEEDNTIDAGYIPGKGSIGNLVFEDTNGNGIQDTNEPGIDGVTVMLLDTDGNIVGTTTTTGGGLYGFDNVPAGDYKVKFTAPTGNTFTTANAGNDDDKDSDATPMTGTDDAMTTVFTVNAGDEITNVDAGLYVPVKLGNRVFEDTNGNGIQDTDEPGIAGVTVMLLDEDGNIIDSKTTNANGIYKFINLAPGTYKIKFPVDATAGGTDYTLTTPEQGTNDNKDSDAVPMNDGSGNAMSELVILESGDNNNSVDAGYFAPVTIGNKIFEDKNGNGIQDTGDTGIDGITVMLLDADGNIVATTTTADGGLYEFANLTPGTYKVKFVEATTAGGNDYQLTSPNLGGNDDTDSDAVPTNDGSGNAMSDLVTLISGDSDNSIDAGYYIPASLGNYVFDDANLNGIQDGSDTGIDGVTVMLLDAAGNVLATTTTVDGGFYEFADLAPGTYKVKFPADFTDGTASYILTLGNEGGDDALDSDAVAMNDGSGNAMSGLVELRSGDNDSTIDAGFIESAKIGDRVFQDVNENGIQDADDKAYTDVVITLFGTDIFGNSINETTTPDQDGFYEFTNLVPGTYELEFTSNQATFIPTFQDFSGNVSDDDDSDISIAGRTDVITLNAGDDNNTIDAGFIFDTSLPVQLISFEAQLVNGNQVLLKWATASEINNRHFIVERSADGTDFRPIGLVEGNGTTNLVNQYSLDDLDPFYGANYYRLKQVDYNGDSEYSNVETVIVSGNDVPDVIVYPNPVIHTTTLRVVTPFETNAQIEIISQSGKIITVLTMEAGANSKQLDLSDYAAGIYYAYINYNGHRTLVHNIVKVDE